MATTNTATTMQDALSQAVTTNSTPSSSTGAVGSSTIQQPTTMSAALSTPAQNPGYQTVDQAYNQLVSTDSPLMQQAAATARQQASARGLGNSSMAVGAAQAAQAQAAVPLAQQMASQSQNQVQYNRSQTEAERAAKAGEGLQQQTITNQNTQYNRSQTEAERAALVAENQNQQQLNNQITQYNLSLGQQQAEFAANMDLQNRQLLEQSQQFAQSIQANARGAYTDAVNNLLNNSSVNINNISSNANITKADKDALIAQELANRNNDLGYLQSLYGSMNAWADRL